jgi:hypothetical protein
MVQPLPPVVMPHAVAQLSLSHVLSVLLALWHDGSSARDAHCGALPAS